MSTDLTTDAPPVGAAGLPESLRPFAADLEAFHHALARLLEDGEKNRYVVLHGGELHGVWDTSRDARQYAYEKFEDGRFLTQQIDPRLAPELTRLFGPPRPPEPTPCPS